MDADVREKIRLRAIEYFDKAQIYLTDSEKKNLEIADMEVEWTCSHEMSHIWEGELPHPSCKQDQTKNFSIETEPQIPRKEPNTSNHHIINLPGNERHGRSGSR